MYQEGDTNLDRNVALVPTTASVQKSGTNPDNFHLPTGLKKKMMNKEKPNENDQSFCMPQTRSSTREALEEKHFLGLQSLNMMPMDHLQLNHADSIKVRSMGILVPDERKL